MNMDLGQNILKNHVTADFLWGKGQLSLKQRPVEFTPDLPRKRCPNLPVCTLLSTKLHPTWKNLLFIPLHLSLPGCPKTPYFQGHNDKPVPVGKQIGKTNWWCVFHLCHSPKGANAFFLSNWILISSLQGQMYHWWGGSPTVSNKMIHKGFLAAFQVLSVYVVYEILHRWHTSGVLAAYRRWQYAMLADDTGMPSSRGSL